MRKTLIPVSILIFAILSLAAFYYLNSNKIKTSPGKTTEIYSFEGQKVSLGFVTVPSDERMARIVGRLIEIRSENGEILGTLELGGVRKDIGIYTKDLPTILNYRKSTEIFSPNDSEEILDSEKKALSAFKKLEGKDIVITLLLKDYQISKSIMDCNRKFADSLNSSTQINCTPQTFRVAIYRPQT